MPIALGVQLMKGMKAYQGQGLLANDTKLSERHMVVC
jgi:hypothetical protein